LEGGLRARPGEGPGQSPEAAREEIGKKSTRKSGTPPRRRLGRHPRLDDNDEPDDKTMLAQNDNVGNEVEDLS